VDELVVALDVGGTNTRARIATLAADGEPRPATPDVTRCVASAHELRDFVSEVAQTAARLGTVTGSVIAVAGPVVGDRIRITNWPSDPVVDISDLEDAGLPRSRTRFVNDAVAGAWGALSRLDPATPVAHTEPLGVNRPGGSGLEDGNLVYVAPGTGLGEAVVVRYGLESRQVTVVAGEYQHTQMPRFSGDIARVVHAIGDALGRAPDWEDLVSGRGLVRTYDALRAIAAHAPLTISDDDAHRAGAVGEAARLGSDPQALAAAFLFYQVLAHFAQMLAITFLPCGAVVFGGVSSERNVELMRRSGMAGTFAEHHRFAGLLAAVPLHVVGGEVNLEGALRLAAQAR